MLRTPRDRMNSVHGNSRRARASKNSRESTSPGAGTSLNPDRGVTRALTSAIDGIRSAENWSARKASTAPQCACVGYRVSSRSKISRQVPISSVV
jgi:hypothetical protein